MFTTSKIAAAVAAVLLFGGPVPASGTADVVDDSCVVVSTARTVEKRFHTTSSVVTHVGNRHVVLKAGVRQYRFVTATTTLCGDDYATTIRITRWRLLVHAVPNPDPVPFG